MSAPSIEDVLRPWFLAAMAHSSEPFPMVKANAGRAAKKAADEIRAEALPALLAEERERIAQAIEADDPAGYFSDDVAEGYRIGQEFAARIARSGGVA